MIIGTAGHIDHGKTSLIKALTGVDTDRLKEEKARGISIELGYAFLPLENGVLGFIDVPGHEKFVDHMVSGATGIDYVLLVVAADDGPMPQTAEHLDIVQLLGVRHGTIALTKIDRCDAARRAAAEKEIRALVADTFLRDAPIFPVSSLTREGLDALKAHLVTEAATAERARPGAGFRLAVDRCFTLDGVGTVVTGTAFAGAIRVGDEVIITPRGLSARVRSIHAQNRKSDVGRAGERCALALSGVVKEDIARGDWVVAPRLHAPTDRLDVRLRLSPRETKPLRHWTAVHLHLGAAHVMARIALLDVEQLAPGGACLAQIVTERPIGALAGDGFIVRDAAGARTLGGGQVLDPFPPARRRKTPQRLALLACMEEPDPGRRIVALVEQSPYGLDLAKALCAGNLAPEDIALGASTVRVRDQNIDRAFTAAAWDKLARHLLEQLAAFHAKHPYELGPDLGRIRRMWFPQLDPPVVAALAESLLAQRRLARSGPWWRLPEHQVRLTQREEDLAKRALGLVEAGGFNPPWVRDMARTLRVGESELRLLMLQLTRRGDVFQVVKDLFYSRSAIARLARIAKEIEDADGAVRAAAFRDRIGTGRKRAIQILEFFDRVAFTRRTRDDHRIRGDNLLRLEEHA
ncbi:MAG TPA: selenocysteine-specific translation elongation factor [Burkholderiales bacterium]